MKNYISFFQYGGPINNNINFPSADKAKNIIKNTGKFLLGPLMFTSCSEGYCNPPENNTQQLSKLDHGTTSIETIPNYNPQERAKLLQKLVNWLEADPDQMSVFVDTLCNTYTGCKKVPTSHAGVYMPVEKVEGKKASNDYGQITDQKYVLYIDGNDLEKGYYRYNTNKVDTLLGFSKWRSGENKFDKSINKTILLREYFK